MKAEISITTSRHIASVTKRIDVRPAWKRWIVRKTFKYVIRPLS